MNLMFLKKSASKLLFGCLFLLSMAISANGQCTLACNGMTNVSLDNTTSNCQALITIGMVADTSGCPGGDFSVVVSDAAGNIIPGALVTSEYIGQILEVMIIDGNSSNLCWGNLMVEDKLPPVIDCSQTATDIFCYELDEFVPVATDNCDNNPEIVITESIEVVNNCNDPAVDDNVLKTVTRTYVAIDDQGLVSNECTFTFTVLRIDDLDDIDEPESLLLANETHLECDSVYHKLPNGHPAPTDTVVNGVTIFGTGVPTLDDNDLFPNAYQACNILVTFVDVELPPIGCATKIMRRWTILEWSCSSPQRTREFIQMIEIVDNEGPAITCPADMTFSTNGSSCESTMILPPVQATDNCSPVLTYTVSYGSGPFLSTNGGLAQLPVGVNVVTYAVYDECLNSNTCTINVTVQDQTPPVVICDQNTTVALTSDGCAYVNAFVFDDGSYDECSNVTFSVRRMDNGVPCETNSSCTTEDDELFDDYVRFCCVDQGADVMVVLRVTDANGNVNDCMVNVEVQDKLAPTIVCPAPVTVNCDYAYDEDNLSDFFGDYIVFDNCGNADATDVLNTSGLNQCNIGIATRTISVGTPGTSNFSVCTQQITFLATNLFNDGVADNLPDTDIEWPDDVNMEGCEDPTGVNYLPENLPNGAMFPTYDEGACDLVGANYEDLIFPFNNPSGDACFKIIRTWTVIDWCQFVTDSSGATTYPKWTHVQIIKVNDSQGPTDIVTTGDESVCTFDSQCADGFIELGATSSDECTPVLDYSYTIFTNPDSDGKFTDILVVDGFPQTGSGASNAIDASGTYPIGTHQIVYSFSDKCGNLRSKEFVFSIVNCKAPTAYCLNGLAVDLMPDGNGGASVQLWATDFDAGSSHPCGYDVYVSFDSIVVSSTGNVDAGNGIRLVVNNGMEFTCDDLGDNLVDIWAAIVTPEGNVVQSYCTGTLNVQDNMNACGGEMRVVSGAINTFANNHLENAEVRLFGTELSTVVTNAEGAYAFPAMPNGGSYSVSPQKNDDYVNGVSTLDLVMIQRHILELQALDSPYKIIASDINNDENINASDLLQLRKLILGTISELPNNGSWRFIDAEFVFEDPTDPFATALPESYDISALNSDMDVNFVAVKVGDINESAAANLHNVASAPRADRTIDLVINEAAFTTGATVSVPVSVTENMITTGMQMTVELSDKISFAGITSSVLDLDDHNVGFSRLSEGIIAISWDNVAGSAISADAPIFELVFVAETNANVSDVLSISSEAINAEMYNADLQTMDVNFVISGRELTNEVSFVLHQNTPNPFADATNIKFDLPAAQEGTLTVFDVTGKVVSSMTRTFDKGYNQITLTRDNLGAAGVLYYTLQVGQYRASRTMILID